MIRFSDAEKIDMSIPSIEKKALLLRAGNASFSPDNRFITIFIDDPNLFMEIRHYIEINGDYVSGLSTKGQ